MTGCLDGWMDRLRELRLVKMDGWMGGLLDGWMVWMEEKFAGGWWSEKKAVNG